MYKLLNFLFGWDYVYWSNMVDEGIARVHVAGDGTVYYYRYKSITIIDKITNKNQVIWLTCTEDKYKLKD